MPSMDVKPSFQAEKVTGKYFRMLMKVQEDVRKVGPNGDKSIITRNLVPMKEEFTDGYMIYFPQGHSIFVAADDVDQLTRIGVLGQPKLVDMNSGEEIPAEYNLTPKEIVEQSQRRARPRMTGGLTEILEGQVDA